MVQPLHETIHELHQRATSRAGTVAPFDPKASPHHERVIFIIGAPRSGTTWLHQLLSTHPDVATGGEAHVFCEGVGALFENHDDADPHMRLSTWLTRPELVALVRQLVDGVFTTMRDTVRPDATRILDKTPNHVPYAAQLAEVYPDASFVHIIRDARDSVSSQRDLWGARDDRMRAWDGAAWAWRRAVEDARTHLADLRYHEVRYEDLVRDTEPGFSEILSAVGLEHDDAFVTDAVDFCRAPINVRASDARVGVRKWADMDPIAERAVVRAAGDLMVELGDLDASDRAAILARRTWRDTVDGARSTAHRTITELRRRRSASTRDYAMAQRANLRETVGSLADAAIAGDRARLADVLAGDVVVESGTERSNGAAGASERLLGFAGGRVVAVTADDRAAAADVIAADGTRHLCRAFVADGRVTKLVLQS